MNHKLVFRKYGVRRPLKMRRRLARSSRVLWRKLGAHERDANGDHERWWQEGQVALHMEERMLTKGEA